MRRYRVPCSDAYRWWRFAGWTLLLALLGLNCWLRLTLATAAAAIPVQLVAAGGDEAGYLNLAEDFWYWLQTGNAVRLPLYPLFLKILLGFGATAWVVFVVQHLGYLLASAALASRLPSRALAGGLFLSLIFYGPFIALPNGFLTETFAASLALLALAALIHRSAPQVARASVLLGIVDLTRPNFVPNTLLQMGGLWLRAKPGRRWAPILGLLLALLPVLAWSARTYWIQGAFIYNTTAAENLLFVSRIRPWDCHHDEVTCLARYTAPGRPENLNHPLAEVQASLKYFDNANLAHDAQDHSLSPLQDVEGYRAMKQLAWENLAYFGRHYPYVVIYLVPRGLVALAQTYQATWSYITYRPFLMSAQLQKAGPLLDWLGWGSMWADRVLVILGLVLLATGSVLYVWWPSWRSGPLLQALLTLVYTLGMPVLSRAGDRFSSVHMILLIGAVLVCLQEGWRYASAPSE